jgi:hypothetical protein
MNRLVLGRDTWQAVVKTVMNFGLHKVLVISWLAQEIFAFQKGFAPWR